MNPGGSGPGRITGSGDFPSFPEFSPDGTELAFCPSRGAKSCYGFNISTADWKKWGTASLMWPNPTMHPTRALFAHISSTFHLTPFQTSPIF
jgi:hypothetical protein